MDKGAPDAEQHGRRETSHIRTTAVDIGTAYANNSHSISRLHDDELSCVLPFLSLADLTRMVRCSRHFNALARKEHSRGLHLEGDAATGIVPLPSSTISHHITSLQLEYEVTRDTLRQLYGLPQLTALQLMLYDDAVIGHFMEGLSPETAAAGLRAVLPTHLRSLSVTAGSFPSLDEFSAALASAFWAALGDMTQLTELTLLQYGGLLYVRPELAHLPHLRKLTMGPAGWRGEHVHTWQQLTQLRELTLHDGYTDRIRLLCQPPHALQLESLTFASMMVDEETMRALLHLPTLTALHPRCIRDDAWPLLPQLPLLRQLSFRSFLSLSREQLSSLCASLSRCSSLEDLTLCTVKFVSADGAPHHRRARS
jgi:hypothetical protein